ncbi:MAG: UvrD-helicase domain-containing protein [Lachnospiraceae bacterium]|nr:UvrD-helicase domain-containing protein [Lachnospiraceae bacterium]
MDFISRILSFGDKLSRKKSISELSPECVRIIELRKEIGVLLKGNDYVAKSEYNELIPTFKDTVEYFRVLQSSKMLKNYCAQNGIDEREVLEIIGSYDHLETKLDAVNDKFIERKIASEKEYLDNILKDVDPVIMLDEDQRKVVLTDEDYCLVIAGAGAGKTTTVAAKVKYLVEKKGIEPRDILVISFTNKAVGELREKINKDLHIDCPIATFHSTGNAILRINDPEPLNIFDGSKLYFLLQDYFKQSILTNESLVNNLIMFFASYFEAPYEGADLNEFFNKTAKANYATMRSELDEFRREVIDARTKKKVTIQNEVLKSYQEVQIANFLYLNNIEYEYEPIYPYNITFSRKPYTPDFAIRQGDKVAYIEHFGVTEDGCNNRFSEEELARYKKSVNDKVNLHRDHGTILIYTFSAYKDNGSLLTHLKDKLEKAGFALIPRSNKEIMDKLISSEESRYVRKLVNLICRFITNFKTNGFDADEFNRMYHSTTNVRSRLFLNICQDCYFEYQRYLKENNAVDFEDMINESARVLRQVKEMKEKLHFKYIIVDEYQDISRQRFDLTTALSEVCDGKIIAVGDDWQSIYAFSGSDISLFTKFQEKMGYAKLLKIVRTYRNAQDVIDIAGNFIQKNPTQIEKQLLSPKTIDNPVIIYTYDNSYKKSGQDRRGGVMYDTANAVEKALDQIIEYNKQAGKKDNGTILLLGRYGFDGDYLERSGLFEYKSRGSKLKSVKYPQLDITFMTVHMAKGLGYDNVIVVNGKNETYGFPSKIEDDPVLSFVIKGDNSIDYAEERRLFYVAITRTKNRVYFIAPEQNPSEFLLEIKNDYKNVVLKGKWNEEEIKQNTSKKVCPICGYPMQFRYKNAYGMKLYMCTNDQEMCGFMTNDIKAGKLAIMKCEKCRDGYLIVKNAGNGYFLGCTNYKKDGTGCNNTIGTNEYFTLKNIEPDFAEPFISAVIAIPVEEKVVVPEMPKEQGDEAIKSSFMADKICEEIKIDVTEKVVAITPAVNDPNETGYKGYDLMDLSRNVISCLSHISENYYFGVSVLISVLRCGNRKQIVKYNLNEVPEYGMYSNMSRDDVRAIIQWMIDNHYMLKTKAKYPVLHPTYNGNHFEKCITKKQLKDLKKYLEDPNREVFEEDDSEE